VPVGLRTSIHRNLTDIVELHEEILTDIRRAVPGNAFPHRRTDPNAGSARAQANGDHHQARHLGAVSEYPGNDSQMWLTDVSGMIADAQMVADVAKVFSKKVRPNTSSFLIGDVPGD